MGDLKFVFNEKRTHVSVETTVQDLLAVVESRPVLSGFNEKLLVQTTFADDTKFAGGSLESLSKPVTDFAAYERAKADLHGSGIMDRLRESSDTVVKRRRARSAYDGEWDHDRKWDIEPFTRRESEQQAHRIVNLDVYAAFAWSVDAAAINRFCTYVSALVELIESRGVMVNLRLVKETRSVSDYGSLDVRCTTVIKRSDQYFNAGELLRAMSSNFYRRAYFMAIILANAEKGVDAAGNLGYPMKYDKRSDVNAETGTLSLYSMPLPGEQEQLMSDLINLIKGDK